MGLRGVRDLPGVLFPSICSQSREITRMTPSGSQLGLCLLLHTSFPQLPPHTLPPGHFLACWMEGDLGTYQLAMMSFFFFFFNKTKQKTIQLCFAYLFKLETGVYQGWEDYPTW